MRPAVRIRAARMLSADFRIQPGCVLHAARMLSACRPHALRILVGCAPHALGSFSAVMLGVCCLLRTLTALLSASNPRLVLVPVVEDVAIVEDVEESDLCGDAYELTGFSLPVAGEFDVLVIHSGEVAVGPVVPSPEDQADERPGS